MGSLDTCRRIGYFLFVLVIALAKSLLAHVIPPGVLRRSAGGTASARYCYSVLLRHLTMVHRAGLSTEARTVAEIGPGASLGTGIAALVAGAENYLGFDMIPYAAHGARTQLFDELVSLLRSRASIPGADEFPAIKPDIGSTGFPSEALPEARLSRALADDRLARIRGNLASTGEDAPVRYVAPWCDSRLIATGTVDWIFSQAVMEHVDDLDATYSACRRWIAPQGLMSHQIDFRSHGTATAWNGHWAYSDRTWRFMGKRAYPINRAPLSAHRAALKRVGFDIISELRVVRHDGLARERLAPRFRELSDEDLETSGIFLVAKLGTA